MENVKTAVFLYASSGAPEGYKCGACSRTGMKLWREYNVKVICEKTGKSITVACRPYNTKNECEVPDWCPFLEEVKA